MRVDDSNVGGPVYCPLFFTKELAEVAFCWRSVLIVEFIIELMYLVFTLDLKIRFFVAAVLTVS